MTNEELQKLQREVVRLRERLADFEDDFKATMASPCDDQHHCTCVPHLRRACRELEEKCNKKSEWSSEFPKEPGHYWFHGSCEMGRLSGREMTTRLWRVFLAGSKTKFLVYVQEGAFIYECEGYEGKWLKIEIPTP